MNSNIINAVGDVPAITNHTSFLSEFTTRAATRGEIIGVGEFVFKLPSSDEFIFT
ncbi:hypothetical protein [[Mycoplasma] mobile]|uniref:hypothetical protein n=1 Tax=[Mycoplasma] mobile TaxID=2118 RepID=UPI0012E9CD60|nr:hypothetical protein [[Mycoplasma] mobile]